MKRSYLLLIVLALCFCVIFSFCACGTEETNPDDTTNSSLNGSITSGTESATGSDVGGAESDIESEVGGAESDVESEVGGAESDVESEVGGAESDVESDVGGAESDVESEVGGAESDSEEDKEQENEDVHTHQYSEWVVTIKPSCTAEGKREKECACGDIVIETVEATGHENGEAVIENSVEADCENDGTYDLVIYCTVCEKEVSRESKTIPATGHENGEAVTENEVKATCEVDGSYDLVIYCTVCKEEVSREGNTTEASGHTSGEAVTENKVEAKCGVNGTYDLVIYCTVCTIEISREENTIVADPHSEGEPVTENYEDPRCDEEGSYELVIYCLTCGEEVSREEKTVPTVSHTPAIPVVENDNRVSCVIASTYQAVTYCNVCNFEMERKTVEVSAKEHVNGEPVMENVTEASCTEDGFCQVVIYCKDCRQEVSREDQVIKAGHKYDGGVCTECGASQAYLRDGDTIYFGSYPQTRVTDSSFINKSLSPFISGTPSVSNPRGWTSYGYYDNGVESDYMWYMDVEVNGERYRAVYFSTYRPDYCMYPSSKDNSWQDDNYYYQKSTYWFKYEPIAWTVAKEENGYAYLLCKMIIDAQQFSYDGAQSNNYEESTIRAWLNDTFYDTVFSELEKSIIQTTLVDNSAKSTGYSSNSYACNDTEDKVYLMSYLEGNTYFDKYDEILDKESTDYAKCQGALGTSFLLRSPDKTANKVRLGNAGFHNSVYSSQTSWGIAPMIQIKL